MKDAGKFSPMHEKHVSKATTLAGWSKLAYTDASSLEISPLST